MFKTGCKAGNRVAVQCQDDRCVRPESVDVVTGEEGWNPEDHWTTHRCPHGLHGPPTRA